MGRKKSAGFLLFDALIAFAIAALALTVMLATFPASTRREVERLYRHQAAEFAFSILEEYRATFPHMPIQGEDPSGWSWSVTESDTKLPGEPAFDLIAYASVEVLTWHRDRPDVVASAQGLIARRRE